MFGDQVKKFRLNRLKAKLKGEKSIFKGGKSISSIIYEDGKAKAQYEVESDDTAAIAKLRAAMQASHAMDASNTSDTSDTSDTDDTMDASNTSDTRDTSDTSNTRDTSNLADDDMHWLGDTSSLGDVGNVGDDRGKALAEAAQDPHQSERLRRIEDRKNSPDEVAYRKAKAARDEELQGLYEKRQKSLADLPLTEIVNPYLYMPDIKEVHRNYLLSTNQFNEVTDRYRIFVQLGRETIHPDDHSPGAERLRSKYAEQDRIIALYEDYVKGRSMLANRFLTDYEESIKLRSEGYYHQEVFDPEDGYIIKDYTHDERVRYYMPEYKYFIDGDEDHELYKSYINDYRTYGEDNWEGPKSYMLSALDGMPMHVAAYEGLDIPMHRANHHFMYFFYVRNIEASLKAIAYIYPDLMESTLAKVKEETSRISGKPWRCDPHYMCPVHIYKDVANHVSEILDEALRDLYVYLGEELFENPHTTNHLRALVGMSKTFYSAWAMTLQWDVQSHINDDTRTLLVLPETIALEEVYYMLMVMVKNTEQILMDEIDSWPVENLQWNHEVVDCLMAILEDHKKRSGEGEFLSWTDLIDLLGEYFARHEDFRDYEDELESFKDRNWDELTQEEITAIVDKMYVYESMYKGIERIFRYYAAAYWAIVDREKRNYRLW